MEFIVEDIFTKKDILEQVAMNTTSLILVIEKYILQMMLFKEIVLITENMSKEIKYHLKIFHNISKI
jgi:hypothetical protein